MKPEVNDTAIWDSHQFGKNTHVKVTGESPNRKVARVRILKAGNTGKGVQAETHVPFKDLRKATLPTPTRARRKPSSAGAADAINEVPATPTEAVPARKTTRKRITSKV